jgi:predicted acylesterase/phospholipase RssA
MLAIEAARRPARGDGRVAIALAGGGPLGAYYEIGALHALAEAIEGLDLTQLETYVGVSSGAVIAAGLANGLDTIDLARIFITTASSDHRISAATLFAPALDDYGRQLARIPALLADRVTQYVRHPFSAGLTELMLPVSHALPAGLFDNEPFERFLRELFSRNGRSNDFRRLRHKLYVVATNLNTGEAAVFGSPRLEKVPISRAVQASTALPGLYRPVAIGGARYVDGALRRTMHASLALEAGATLMLCLNPLVAFNASRARAGPGHADLAEQGMPTVLSQTFRALIQSRMQVGMADYPKRYPGADILLFEPDPNDVDMFVTNVFGYSDRRQLTEHAYQRTRADLRRSAPRLRRLLARHGLELRLDVLRDRRKNLIAELKAQARATRRVSADLNRTLERLRSLVVRA